MLSFNFPIDIDECAPSPCVHGNCADGINDYTCTCNPGWEGKDCDIGKNCQMH